MNGRETAAMLPLQLSSPEFPGVIDLVLRKDGDAVTMLDHSTADEALINILVSLPSDLSTCYSQVRNLSSALTFYNHDLNTQVAVGSLHLLVNGYLPAIPVWPGSRSTPL